RPRNPVPTYRKNPRDNSARCWVAGRGWVHLGPWQSPESIAEFNRICAELQTQPAAVTAAPRGPLTVGEVLVAFREHALRHYRRPDGTATKELGEYRSAAVHLRELYGQTPAAEFGPLALQAVRQK